MACASNEITWLVVNWMKNNDIKHMCAQFEAEWQCVCLERMNPIDAAMSSDGDCITHGVSKLHC